MARQELDTCTVSAVASEFGCTQCASQTQLIAVLAVTLYALNHSGDYDLEDMLTDAACYKCLSDHQMLEGIINAFVDLAIARKYFDDYAAVIHAAECLTCTDPRLVKGLIVKQTCEYVASQLAP